MGGLSNHEALDVKNHPRTANLDPEWYRNFFETNHFPYVRVVPKVHDKNPKKKAHKNSATWGTVCVEWNCPVGDVHRHPDKEVRIVE